MCIFICIFVYLGNIWVLNALIIRWGAFVYIWVIFAHISVFRVAAKTHDYCSMRILMQRVLFIGGKITWDNGGYDSCQCGLIFGEKLTLFRSRHTETQRWLVKRLETRFSLAPSHWERFRRMKTSCRRVKTLRHRNSGVSLARKTAIRLQTFLNVWKRRVLKNGNMIG